MADFKSINQFRKGRLTNFNEDPTYLSFFFIFDFVSGDSPLFNGQAESYLRNVVGDEARATSLANFKKILQKVNREMPWYWQSVTGLDAARVYNNLKEPYWGAENPKLEIECLENVELSTAAMIDLYKRAAFDYVRWVEVIPKNLRYFQMWVYVTEVRTFQSNTERKNLSSRGKNESNIGENTVTDLNTRFVGESKPFFQVKLSHCEIDPDSTSGMFSELSKNPEITSQKINIFWRAMEQVDQVYATSTITDASDETRISREAEQNTPGLQGKIRDAANNVIETGQAAIDNIVRGATGGPGLGNAHGSLLTGVLGNVVSSIGEEVAGDIILGNVHGINAASTIQDVLNAGSINGIVNAVSSVASTSNSNGGGSVTPNNAHGNTQPRSTGPINPRNVYE